MNRKWKKKSARETGSSPQNASSEAGFPVPTQSGGHAAISRCCLCGRSVEGHGIVLVFSHAIARGWSGESKSGNLTALCEECDAGTKACCMPPDAEWMDAVMAQKSIHVRLGETLKAFEGNPVDAATLRLVAQQSGWEKRTRELRYLGWDIHVFNRKLAGGRVSSYYQLRQSQPWPDDPTGVIRQYEQDRARRNKKAGRA